MDHTKSRPVLSTRNQFLESGQHLATVADTNREGVRSLEEGLKGPAGTVVHKNGLGPAITGTENITNRSALNIEVAKGKLTHKRNHRKQPDRGNHPKRSHRGYQTCEHQQRQSQQPGRQRPSQHGR